ncbi:hypothetical protein [Frigoriflavimonas asaccharolytica]|uniref:Uncharacterized protein n=1 Tax=Frigoriflavimonas asaccharolytica TaxID=2735899 RepID=A0A8J8K8V6_9FLAO|nr:hypothetical protein [Frigoriflavimonas asaccharolytica]NRS93273.1 hypothetical protein [Frigoriflavimonas asaccharolytica]
MANPGVEFVGKTPIKRKLITKYFVRGWWTDSNDMPISEALFGDTVKFHLQTQEIPIGENVTLKLFDDDNILNTIEDHEDDEIGLVYSTNGQAAITDQVDGNKKVVKTIILDNFEKMLRSEADGILELYFKCTYDSDVDVKMPDLPQNYLQVKGVPKIILVNGHWNRIANFMGMSPGSGGEGYWNFFTGNVKGYKTAADNYFGIKSKEPHFVDGSSLWGGSESGGQRKKRGYEYARENFDELKRGLGNEKAYVISHSEGGACAAGVCQYLKENNIDVGESLMLSADEGDEFTVEGNYPCYQITAGYLTHDYITKRSRFEIDPVVMDNRISGVNRYGVYISNGGLTTVHGATINTSVFNLVTTLKTLNVQLALNSQGQSVHQTSPMDEKWYRIDEYRIYNKKIDIYPTNNSNIIEMYRERQD